MVIPALPKAGLLPKWPKPDPATDWARGRRWVAGAWRAQPCDSKSSPCAGVLSIRPSTDVISSPPALVMFRNAGLRSPCAGYRYMAECKRVQPRLPRTPFRDSFRVATRTAVDQFRASRVIQPRGTSVECIPGDRYLVRLPLADCRSYIGMLDSFQVGAPCHLSRIQKRC